MVGTGYAGSTKVVEEQERWGGACSQNGTGSHGCFGAVDSATTLSSGLQSVVDCIAKTGEVIRHPDCHQSLAWHNPPHELPFQQYHPWRPRRRCFGEWTSDSKAAFPPDGSHAVLAVSAEGIALDSAAVVHGSVDPEAVAFDRGQSFSRHALDVAFLEP